MPPFGLNFSKTTLNPRRKLRADFDTEGLDDTEGLEGARRAVLERFGRAVGDDRRKQGRETPRQRVCARVRARFDWAYVEIDQSYLSCEDGTAVTNAWRR